VPVDRITPRDYWTLIRTNRNFRLLWSAQVVSEICDWSYSVAIYSLLLEVTGSAQSIALAIVLQVLPQALIAPAAGVIHDRMSRRQVMIFADLVRAVLALAMLMVARGEMVWALYVLLFLETTMWGLFEPGRSAVLPSITRGRELVVANAIGSSTWSMNLAIGTAVGGLVAAFFGRHVVFVLNSVSFVISALLLRAMRFEETHVASQRFRAADLLNFRPIVEGVRYIRSSKRLFTLLLAKAGIGIMGSHWVILPVYGERLFPVEFGHGFPKASAGMLGMSLLMAARGVGALLGPLIGNAWAGRDEARMRKGILIGFGVAAVGYVALGFAPSLLTASLSIMVAHSGASMVWVYSTTLLQLLAEDRFRGRVFSADFAFLVVAMSLTSTAAGQAIDAGVSVRTVAVLTGCLAVFPVLAWRRAMKMKEWSCGATRTAATDAPQ
jgi:MFS family permease